MKYGDHAIYRDHDGRLVEVVIISPRPRRPLVIYAVQEKASQAHRFSVDVKRLSINPGDFVRANVQQRLRSVRVRLSQAIAQAGVSDHHLEGVQPQWLADLEAWAAKYPVRTAEKYGP